MHACRSTLEDPTPESAEFNLTPERLLAENAELRARLAEAEETLRAIRAGEVDAIIVSGNKGDQIYSLSETENLHRLMVETMNEAGMAVTPEGLLLYCNGRAGTLLGRPKEHLLGQDLAQFVAPRDAERFQHLLQNARASVADDRIRFVAAEGWEVPMLVWASHLTRSDGTVICMVATDLSRVEAYKEIITELRQQKEAVHRSEERLRLALEAAQAADRAKDRFLATLSHELRTPLTPVLITTSRLQRTEDLSPEVSRSLDLIRRNVEIEARMVNDLLDLSRIINGKLDLQLDDEDAHQLVRDALETCAAGKAGQLQIAMQLNARRHHVRADGARMQQVFWNLIQNAFKFTPVGGTLTIRSENEGEYLRVSVADNGRGIEESVLEKIFQPFEQGDRRGPGSQQGLGLGLAIARRLVTAHGGTLAVASEGKNRGATFTVKLKTVPPPPDTNSLEETE